jgi:succinate-semialdehyde dehydrogenase / glutarate-semialdehyde dehydrogenase
MTSVDPSTGEIIRTYPEFSTLDADNALYQAFTAFGSWRNASFDERAKRMTSAGVTLKKNKTAYAKIITQEMGKPLRQAEAEIEKCAWVCDFYAQKAKEYLAPEDVKTDAKKSFITFEPLGVILAVMPWNFPFWQVFRCAAPTLMAGNAMVLKHASNVCGCSLAIEDVFKQAGFPEGLFRSVLIDSKQVARLIEHPMVSAVTLTGSTEAGRAVAAQAGRAIKKAVLELGGSDAYIVLKDADIAKAAQVCAASRMINGGQSCVSAKRFIVEDDIAKEFETLFIKNLSNQVMGSPLDEETTLGPMARHDLRDQIHEQVKESVELGARLALGGKIPSGPGAFYPPTVLADVKAGMPAYKDEIFGPVAAIITVSDEKEAIHVANDSSFGLGSAIFTRDVQHAEQLAAHQLQAGCCFVNDFVKSDPRLPFGGVKLSGFGRELGAFGIREFTNIKTVYIN